MSAADLGSMLALIVFAGLAVTVVASVLVCAWARWVRVAYVWPTQRYGVPHNVIGHTLLVVCRPVGEWVHDRTRPLVPTFAGRRLLRRLPAGAVLDGTRGGWHVDDMGVHVFSRVDLSDQRIGRRRSRFRRRQRAGRALIATETTAGTPRRPAHDLPHAPPLRKGSHQ